MHITLFFFRNSIKHYIIYNSIRAFMINDYHDYIYFVLIRDTKNEIPMRIVENPKWIIIIIIIIIKYKKKKQNSR